MHPNVVHKETITDEHRLPVTIEFSVCEENGSQILYCQPQGKIRKDVDYDDLHRFMKTTLVKLLVKFHHYGVTLYITTKQTETHKLTLICRRKRC